jgi:ABC-type multidrug transport system ATPase subunit
MEKYQFDNCSNIFEFKKKEVQDFEGVPLNDFLAFLKFNRVLAPYKFSYVGNEGNLIQDLTLKQNLLLDYTSASLTEEKELHFKNFIKEKANTFLEALYTSIVNINDVPANATKEEIKIVCLMKALISEVPFIFLENPEQDLSPVNFKNFKEALKYQVKLQTQNVFITTFNSILWDDIITKVVTRNEDYSFKVTDKIIQNNFNIMKKEFFKNQNKETTNLPALQFKIPKKSRVA